MSAEQVQGGSRMEHQGPGEEEKGSNARECAASGWQRKRGRGAISDFEEAKNA